MKKYSLLVSTLLLSISLLTACTSQTKETETATSTTTSQTSTSTTEASQTPSSSSQTETSTSSSSDPLSNRETGVDLEAGQVTIDYANQILGAQSWTVIHDNYNRTESIPHTILLAEDGTTYEIYQNGVIVDGEGNLIHQP